MIVASPHGPARETLLNTYTGPASDIPSSWTGTQAEYFRDVIIPAYEGFLEDLDTQFHDFVTYWTRTGSLVPSQGGPTVNVFTQRPATHRYTENQISRGYELEFTANPTPNWRIAVTPRSRKRFVVMFRMRRSPRSSTSSTTRIATRPPA